jgi:hypothetical protein
MHDYYSLTIIDHIEQQVFNNLAHSRVAIHPLNH